MVSAKSIHSFYCVGPKMFTKFVTNVCDRLDMFVRSTSRSNITGNLSNLFPHFITLDGSHMLRDTMFGFELFSCHVIVVLKTKETLFVVVLCVVVLVSIANNCHRLLTCLTGSRTAATPTYLYVANNIFFLCSELPCHNANALDAVGK